MQASPRPGPRLAKGATACQRCRRRKQKCDLKSPSCSNCERANATCLTYHSGKNAEYLWIPRDYVSNLEAQLERLARENQQLRSLTQASTTIEEDAASFAPSLSATRELSCTPTEVPPIGTDPDHLQDLVKSVRNTVVEPSRQPRFLGPSSGITLARMVMASINTEALSASLVSKPRQQTSVASNSHPAVSSAAAEASLPPRHAADHLVDVYFQYRTPHLPILERAQVESAIENAYLFINGQQNSNRLVERDIFTTYMVLAIALCNVPNPAGGTGRVLQSEGCFRSAISRVENVISYSKSDVETLRAVLLLAQFISMCPWQGSLWHLTGIALRLCIDIGLHWEAEEQIITMDQDTLYERRRLWHSTYQFDRVLAITLGRPFGIADEGVKVALPNPWAAYRRRIGQSTYDLDIHHQRAHNHLSSLCKLESEIKNVHTSQTWPMKLSSPKPNFAIWLEDIKPRLQEWYSTIPEISKAHSSSIFANQAYWDYVYYNAILLLYRPSSNMQGLPVDASLIAHEAACKVITSIKALQREGKLDVLWKAVHHLFIAGLTVIYGLWQFEAIRDQNSTGNSIATMQMCSATLSAMSETFHGAAGCRDIFETLSSATVSRLVNNDAEMLQQNQLDFDKQIVDFMQQLQPARADWHSMNDGSNNMSAMLSTDIFSEMLSSAAQWPDYNVEVANWCPDNNGFWFPPAVDPMYS